MTHFPCQYVFFYVLPSPLSPEMSSRARLLDGVSSTVKKHHCARNRYFFEIFNQKVSHFSMNALGIRNEKSNLIKNANLRYFWKTTQFIYRFIALADQVFPERVSNSRKTTIRPRTKPVTKLFIAKLKNKDQNILSSIHHLPFSKKIIGCLL